MDKATVLALREVMSTSEIAQKLGMNRQNVRRLLRGDRSIGKVDESLINKAGYKLCQACRRRIVPKEPVNYQILTRLCKYCWEGEGGMDELSINIGGFDE